MGMTIITFLVLGIISTSSGLKCYSCDDVVKPSSCQNLEKVKTVECRSDQPVCVHSTFVADDMGKSIYMTRGCGLLEDEDKNKVGQCMQTGPTVNDIKKRYTDTVAGAGTSQRSSLWVCSCNSTDACNGGVGVKVGQTPSVTSTILVAAAVGVITWMGFITSKL